MTTSFTHGTDVPPPPPRDRMFAQLVELRRMYGQLAEYSRSHHGQDRTTAAFDAEVAAYSDELEHRYPTQWERLWPEIVVDEAAMLHDPDTRPVLTCGLCQLHRRAQLTKRAADRRPRTSSRTVGRPAGGHGAGDGAVGGQLGQVA